MSNLRRATLRRVKITYFKPSGKYYTDGLLEVPESITNFYALLNYIKDLQLINKMPGVLSAKGFHFTLTYEDIEFADQIRLVPHFFPALEG